MIRANVRLHTHLPEGEHRRAARKMLAAQGLIGIPGFRLTVPCLIQDMSATGAQITILPTNSRIRFAKDLPDEIVLSLLHDQVEVDGTVRWRDCKRLGIAFGSAFRPSRP